MERHRNFDFFAIRVYYGKLCHMLKPLKTKLHPDISAHLKDTFKKQVPTKLKPIVVTSVMIMITGFYGAMINAVIQNVNAGVMQGSM